MTDSLTFRDTEAEWPEENLSISGPPVEQQWAIIVGIDAYDQFTELENAAHDAAAVADLLQNDYGFELRPGGEPLIDGSATWDAIHDAVELDLKGASGATRWLFYFAGHGTVRDGTGYLVPFGTRKGDLSRYLSLQWLLDLCKESICGEILIILDACYSGQALVRGETLAAEMPSEDDVRVRQIITSGNPRERVLDGGGSNHSIFTQALLDGLQGWGGIHEHERKGGQVRFTSLLDYLVYEVPGRLLEARQGAAHQQPIGGYFVGNSKQREFVFQPKPTIYRLPPEIILDLRSEDAARRASGLKDLIEKVTPETHDPAVELTVRHLQSRDYSGKFWTQRGQTRPLVGRSLRYESVAKVRTQAAKTLSALKDSSAVEPLIAALDDVPEVCQASAQALGQLADLSAAPALLARLRKTDDRALILELVDAIGAIGDSATVLEALRESLRQGLLVPFVGPDFHKDLTGIPTRAEIARWMADGEGLPSTSSLADVANATIPGKKRYIETCPKCDAVQYKSGNRHRFIDLMRRRLDTYVQPGPIYQILANLPAAFWISGVYDDLLQKALEKNGRVNTVFKGFDTQLQMSDPTVVRLAGDITRPDSLRVLEVDYEEQLRVDRLLTRYLLDRLQNKIVLFLGYDPYSPDFALLVKHILNGHLAAVNARAFIVWSEVGPSHEWGRQLIRPVREESLALVRQLTAGVSSPIS